MTCALPMSAFGYVVYVNHQVFGIAKTQKAQGNIGRENTSIGPHAFGFETLWPLLAGPGALPQVQPAIHVQARLEVDQGALNDAARRIAQHDFGGAVGITYMAIPVDPDTAELDRASLMARV